MLRIHFGDRALSEHRDAIEAYCNIYLSGLTEEFHDIEFSISANGSEMHKGSIFDARLKAQPLAGPILDARTKAGEVNTAIETCFARARRAIIRNRKLAALAS